MSTVDILILSQSRRGIMACWQQIITSCYLLYCVLPRNECWFKKWNLKTSPRRFSINPWPGNGLKSSFTMRETIASLLRSCYGPWLVYTVPRILFKKINFWIWTLKKPKIAKTILKKRISATPSPLPSQLGDRPNSGAWTHLIFQNSICLSPMLVNHSAHLQMADFRPCGAQK